MSFPGLMQHPVAILKPGVKLSRAGDSIKDWDNPTRTASGCWLWSKKAVENEGLDDESILEVVLFFPTSADIKNEDRIEALGHTFHVDGPPMPKYTLRGLHHYEVQAKAEL